ncbi:MAG: cell division protein FtsZ [Sphingomonadaceae bacterium]|uniref:cell division protein FtsZ n=1 Tax=Thermaurantiacus sp. TaxID=2820283 RepID=UPI00298F32D5|nr:cell division protein FtsZ [Thermaurantiacus sp.]MCS6986924.1 cell division protein FtsZ [Sphingomonadaceae bacterium]MDW8415476.1 cell division protein FtsZ [Thermaurantiacus sp.]
MPFDFMKTGFTELKPRITVFGVGGAGCNAVANMIADGLQGVDFVVANTDAQSLSLSPAERRIQLGPRITQGLGAGARPEIGCAAAEEVLTEIEAALEGTHMCFITAGMGGGTGTGAAPVVARAARERGILTVGVVTKPFAFEGVRRMRVAEEGIAELERHVDTLIVIPNQNLFLIASPQTTFREAFKMADQVLNQGVRGITDLMLLPGLINLDFADVRTVMSEMGKAMMGTGEATGERRAIEAAERAVSNPLLDEVSLRGAKAVLINITGGEDLGLMEVEEAAQYIRDMVDPEANIIVGSGFDTALEGRMRVSVVATGIETRPAQRPELVARAPGRTSVPVFGAPARGMASATPAADGPAAALHPTAEAPCAAPAVRLAAEVEGPTAAPAVRLPAEADAGPVPPARAAVSTSDTVEATPDPEPVLDLPEPEAPVTRLPLPEPERRAREREAAPAEPDTEEPPARRPTLFERIVGRVRRPEPEPVATLAPEPDAPADDGLSIPPPPFFRAQRN